jgi:hypothetical protein
MTVNAQDGPIVDQMGKSICQQLPSFIGCLASQEHFIGRIQIRLGDFESFKQFSNPFPPL